MKTSYKKNNQPIYLINFGLLFNISITIVHSFIQINLKTYQELKKTSITQKNLINIIISKY